MRGLQEQGVLSRDVPNSARSIGRAILDEIDTGEFSVDGGVLHEIVLPLVNGKTFRWTLARVVGVPGCFGTVLRELALVVYFLMKLHALDGRGSRAR